ncbi:hypothetical protein EVAR_4373_1 [Eumeta japonica]|uniref:Uncharacterized protein n=1 Tax=Eumeta variegata TaxID=151549 RepID=A0A4C1SYC6_EUMVA|nr:hypothetical protein EVAR_4373_1 [Eumeta japonica]
MLAVPPAWTQNDVLLLLINGSQSGLVFDFDPGRILDLDPASPLVFDPGQILNCSPDPNFDSNPASHTFDCNPDPASVFDPNSVLRFGPGSACDSVPIRFYSRPVRNSLPHPAFNPDFATSHNSDLVEAGSKGSRYIAAPPGGELRQRG